MLTEEKRKELDLIVQDMIKNKETDFSIKFVVDDFKKKYGGIEQITKPETDLIAKTSKVLGSIFGGEKIGEAIGTQIAKARVPEDQKQFIQGPKASQVAGDIAATALSVAGFKGLGTVGKFVPRLLKTIGLGAGLTGSKAISEGEKTENVVKSASIGGLISGTIPIAGAGLRAIGRQIESLPSRFINSALSRSKSEVLQDIAKDKVDDFAKYVIQKKTNRNS